jgi:ABC-type Na+ transport system ATPase subunit NatA
MSGVSARALKKSFGSQAVLKGIDLDVAPGEVVGLIGPNGAGKTTLMSCLLAFLHLDDGEITIDGLPNDDLRIRRRTGFVPERMNFDRGATGYSFLRYIAGLARVDDRDAKVRAMLERLGIAGAADKRLSQYSRGMLQRMCQALIHEPDFLFLDEPTSGLDPNGVLLEQRADQQRVGEHVEQDRADDVEADELDPQRAAEELVFFASFTRAYFNIAIYMVLMIGIGVSQGMISMLRAKSGALGAWLGTHDIIDRVLASIDRNLFPEAPPRFDGHWLLMVVSNAAIAVVVACFIFRRREVPYGAD